MSGTSFSATKPRRRDRILEALAFRDRSRLVSSSSPSSKPAISNQTNISHPASLPSTAVSGFHIQNTPTSNTGILNNALRLLSEDERETLKPFILPSVDDVNVALEQCSTAAKEKRRDCLQKRWTFTVRGHEIILKDQADKVVYWLDRFKAVGDVAVNADPVHAGLPWAGIRLLLEVATAESTQAASLLVGCETVLYMANRLKAYMDFLNGLPTNLTRTNLVNDMTQLYTEILRFLAHAIQIYQKSTLQRALTAFWQIDDVQQFEQKCEKIAANVEIEASNCDRTLSGQDRGTIAQIRQDMQKVLLELERGHQFQASLNRIEIKLDLDKLRYARGATFDASGQVHRACHRATRVELLRDIHGWAQNPQSKSIFWLCGMAGTGKSTISMTISQWLTDQVQSSALQLGASFFFKRGEGDRGSAAWLIPTIVRQLVMKVPNLDVAVAKVLASCPDICDKGPAEQFRMLLLKPLQEVSLTTGNVPITVIVIDALDECENKTDIRTLLQLWSMLPQVANVNLKLFLTSRPEEPFRHGFKKMDGNIHHDIALHDVPLPVIRHDIRAFLEHEFTRIREDHNEVSLSATQLSRDWPGDDALEELTNTANPLFIVAATICRFIDEPPMDPREQLSTILQIRKTGRLSQMRQTYMPILDQWKARAATEMNEIDVYKDFQTIVGAIVMLAEPLSIMSLATLLDKPIAVITARLRSLHSVLQVPTDEAGSVRPLHLSFSEFLSSEELQNHPFSIDSATTHSMLLAQCLQLLSGDNGLHENMCNLPYPGYLRQDVASDTIQRKLSPTMQYACRYWVHHALHGGLKINDDHRVYLFLRIHFLHWLEALSLLNRLTDMMNHIEILKQIVEPDNSNHLTSFLEDARRFVLAHRFTIGLTPLQLYPSAIIFTPQQSKVRNTYRQVAKWIKQYPVPNTGWSSELQKLEGHTDGVNAVAFSRDGRLLASASWDRTIRLWDPSTGQTVQTLEGHTTAVSAVAFSQDRRLLASASWSRTVRLWDLSTGQTVQTLKGHTDGVNAVAFSRDGRLLASASWDDTIRLWDPSTGQTVQTLEGHIDAVNAVAFSQDGRLLASASWDRIVRLWSLDTGQSVQVFHTTETAYSILFSENNKMLFTEHECLIIGSPHSVLPTQESNAESKIELRSGWIRQDGKRLLRLPQEYREGCWAFHNDILAFGLKSGQVGFLQITYP